MTFRLMFTLAAIVFFAAGVVWLLVPRLSSAAFGIEDPSAEELLLIRFIGAFNFGFGVVAWICRNAEASKVRDAAAVGFVAIVILLTILDLFGIAMGTLPSSLWGSVAVDVLFVAGFATAFRAANRDASPTS